MLKSLIQLASNLVDKELICEASRIIRIIAYVATDPWSRLGNEMFDIASGLESKLKYLKETPNIAADFRRSLEKLEHRLERMQEWWMDSLVGKEIKGEKEANQFLDKFIQPILTETMPELKEAMARARKGGEYNFLLADVTKLATLPAKFPAGVWTPPKPSEPYKPKSKIYPRFGVPMQGKPGYPIPGDPKIHVYRNPQPAMAKLREKLIAIANDLDKRGHLLEANAVDSLLPLYRKS